MEQHQWANSSRKDTVVETPLASLARDNRVRREIREQLMSDLKDPRLIYLKGFLFLLGSILASGALLLENLSVRNAILLAIAIWCSARFYYFMFYVIEHYVDGQYRFAGLWSFIIYLFRSRTSRDRDAS